MCVISWRWHNTFQDSTYTGKSKAERRVTVRKITPSSSIPLKGHLRTLYYIGVSKLLIVDGTLYQAVGSTKSIIMNGKSMFLSPWIISTAPARDTVFLKPLNKQLSWWRKFISIHTDSSCSQVYEMYCLQWGSVCVCLAFKCKTVLKLIFWAHFLWAF